ncbi:hypothetical protein EVAR_18309_1 [Eumeta japonica]|uniref:Uncharacterized protein n=1 Tax=Eumeta variegata TaxID=151549 RepID=A0A4C1VB47_EUMVA|nr:hypothetical protein EVAR_18309_1 [Eumeta japonica]
MRPRGRWNQLRAATRGHGRGFGSRDSFYARRTRRVVRLRVNANDNAEVIPTRKLFVVRGFRDHLTVSKQHENQFGFKKQLGVFMFCGCLSSRERVDRRGGAFAKALASSTARGRPIIVEWERDGHSAGLSRSVTHRYVTERYTFFISLVYDSDQVDGRAVVNMNSGHPRKRSSREPTYVSLSPRDGKNGVNVGRLHADNDLRYQCNDNCRNQRLNLPTEARNWSFNTTQTKNSLVKQHVAEMEAAGSVLNNRKQIIKFRKTLKNDVYDHRQIVATARHKYASNNFPFTSLAAAGWRYRCAAARGRPIIVEWGETQAFGGLSRSVTHRNVTERYTFHNNAVCKLQGYSRGATLRHINSFSLHHFKIQFPLSAKGDCQREGGYATAAVGRQKPDAATQREARTESGCSTCRDMERTRTESIRKPDKRRLTDI